jgi:hypothetical protein
MFEQRHVEERHVEESATQGAGDSPEVQAQHWEGWTRKRKIGRKRVTRSITAAVVRNLTDAWWFSAQKLGLNFNRFVTFRPHDVDQLNPEQRGALWHVMLNKLSQFARDHGFECVLVWSRESKPGSGAGEHLHVLMHVPPQLFSRFHQVVTDWLPHPDEIKIKPADYQTRNLSPGKRGTVLRYVTKNSPQAAWGTDRMYQKGGPILGKRAGCSRNVDARARAAWEARQAIRRDLGITGRVSSSAATA